ncbi:hypothetical protein PVAG01_07114 [Phlyctema vagabunda]|uniref:C6 transcription factor n=1 Tax=Phlyctema vagabunda TaxID=108571 RepID=A0ABR4PBH7_9HELO
MAHLKPERQQYYLAQAMDLHHAALSKGSPALSDITSENCEALYLFSALTCFFALARPREPTDFLFEKNTPLSEWLLMFRGTRIVIESSNQPILHAGPLGPMFAIGGRRANMQVASLTQIDHLWMLQRFINGTSGNEEDLRTYNRAIDELRQAFNVVYNEHPEFCETTDVFLWLYRVSEEYLALLNSRKPEALSIFAYFCVLLKRLDAKWWTHGWSTHLIAQIHQVLDPEHRLWIVWPMREIGWAP